MDELTSAINSLRLVREIVNHDPYGEAYQIKNLAEDLIKKTTLLQVQTEFTRPNK